MFARFCTKVTVLQRGDSILSHVEKPLAHRLIKVLASEGVSIITNAKVTKAHKENDKKIVTFTANEKEQAIEGDEILLAARKTANTKELGLDITRVDVNERHTVVVNPTFQTSSPHIFAIGDVTGASV